MSADQTASAIQISIEICLQLRNEVILGKISLILQAAADNLLDCAVMSMHGRNRIIRSFYIGKFEAEKHLLRNHTWNNHEYP